MSTETTVTPGSDNIFADLGLSDASERLIKARIINLINQLIEQRNLSQTDAAEYMGISQPDVSKLVRGRISGYSMERLISFVLSLGCDVDIKIRETDVIRKGRLRLDIAA